MSAAEFYRLTPDEFAAIYECWAQTRDSEARRSWEQTRLLATCALQPYSKRRLSPADVLPLPWDNDDTPKPRPQSHADTLRRMREVARQRGIK